MLLNEIESKKLEKHSSEQWDDVISLMDNPSITIDETKATSWVGAQEEALYIKIRLYRLTNIDSPDISTRISHFFRPDTAITKPLINFSSMKSYSEFSCFMAMICLQATYRLSTTDMYH